MDTLCPRCAGIDVHKGNVVVCIRCCDRPGKAFEEVRTFSTMTSDLARPFLPTGQGMGASCRPTTSTSPRTSHRTVLP